MSVDLEPLYRAPLAAWVAERKALAATVKAAGDRDGAAAIGKLPRPTPAAWAANQLWFHARAVSSMAGTLSTAMTPPCRRRK